MSATIGTVAILLSMLAAVVLPCDAAGVVPTPTDQYLGELKLQVGKKYKDANNVVGEALFWPCTWANPNRGCTWTTKYFDAAGLYDVWWSVFKSDALHFRRVDCGKVRPGHIMLFPQSKRVAVAASKYGNDVYSVLPKKISSQAYYYVGIVKASTLGSVGTNGMCYELLKW